MPRKRMNDTDAEFPTLDDGSQIDLSVEEADAPGAMDLLNDELAVPDSLADDITESIAGEICTVTPGLNAALTKRDEQLLQSAVRHAQLGTVKFDEAKYKAQLKREGYAKKDIDKRVEEWRAQNIHVDPITLRDFKKILQSRNPSMTDYRTMYDMYKLIQATRIRQGNQLNAVARGVDNVGVQGELLAYCFGLMYAVEDEVAKLMKYCAQRSVVGRWMLGVRGIGPALACGWLGRLDIDKAPHAGNFQSYAGLNDNNRPKIIASEADAIIAEISQGASILTPEQLDEVCIRTQWPLRTFNDDPKCVIFDKRNPEIIVGYHTSRVRSIIVRPPYSKPTKVIAYQTGLQFQKLMNRPTSLYGRMVRERRIYESDMNNRLEYADQAAAILERFNYDKDTVAYQHYIKGMLPPAHIIQRCNRYATKLFVSALHGEMMYVKTGGQPPEKPWIITFGGHQDYIEPEVPFSLE